MNAIISGLDRIFEGIARLTPGWLIALLARGSVAYTFWSSGRSKVSGFLGGRSKPAPISDEEADQILNRMEAGKLKPKPKYYFETGDEVSN